MGVQEDPQTVPPSYNDCELTDFTCKQLRDVCRSHGWTGFSTLRKKELVMMITGKLEVLKKAIFDADRMLVARPMVPINDVDAITQEDLGGWNPRYLFRLESSAQKTKGVREVVRRVHQFSPMSLVEMLLQTGEAKNPFTREDLTPADIRRLEEKYFSCLRILPEAPSTKSTLLRFRRDVDEGMIEAPPSRQDLGLKEDDPLPVPPSSFVPWEETKTLEQLTKERFQQVREARETAEALGWLQDQMVLVADTVEAYLQRQEGPSGLPAPCAQYIDMALALYAPMIAGVTRDLAAMDVKQMWTEARKIVVRLRAIAEQPMTIATGTAAVCLLGVYLDQISDIISAERLAPRTPQRGRDAAEIYPEIREWARSHSSAAVIRNSVHTRLMQIMYTLEAS